MGRRVKIPIAVGSFAGSAPIDLGAEAADGEAIQVSALGDLTIRDVTESQSVLSVEDHGTLELQFLLVRS